MQIADTPHPIAPSARDTLLRFRELLLAAGFLEPTKMHSRSWHWRFYKPLTSLTAFIVNLQGYDDHVDVTYGCHSTAYTLMANNGDALTALGEDDSEITIRERLSIRRASDEAAAALRIRQMYDQYTRVEKDDLLAIARERRKAFIQRIALQLKPLGLRKKGNKWTKPMPGNLTLTFHLDKSSYADMYYFDVMLRSDSLIGLGSCYDGRVAPEGEPSGRWRMDWQLTPPEVIDRFLEERLLPRLLWLLSTPYAELGADPTLWAHCDCDRKHCDTCWVQKNLWEAKAST